MRRWMWLVAALGLAIRVALIPAPGFPEDIGAFEDWALGFARFGPHALYADSSNLRWPAVDYPPAYLLVLGAVGWFASHVFHIERSGGLPFATLVKLPAILADIALAFVGFRIALRVTDRVRARILFCVVLLAPPLWIVSGYWGQVDSVSTLVLFCALLAALGERMTLAWTLLALAILIKPQAAPIAFVLLLWELRTLGPSFRMVLGAACGALLAYAIAAVFSPTLAPAGLFRWLLGRYLVGIAKYPNGSSGAFNAYSIGGAFWSSDARRIFGITLHDLGLTAFFVLLTAVLVYAWTRMSPLAEPRERERAMLSACFVILVGLFMIVTRMHERYFLPGLALGAVVATWSKGMAFAEVVLASIFTLNCAFILGGFYGGSHHPITLLVARIASLVNVLTFAAILARYFADGTFARRTSSRIVALKNARSSTTL